MKIKHLIQIVFITVFGFTLVSCGSGNTVDETTRKQIIEDYIHGQETYYEWLEGSVTVTDEGDLVFVEFQGKNTSYEYSTIYSESNYEPTASGAPSGQMEADLLKHSLRASIVLCMYSSDGYLLSINYAQYPDTSEEQQNQTEKRIDELITSALDFVAENKGAWLDGLCTNTLNENVGYSSDISYELQEGVTEINIVMAPNSSALFDDEERQLTFNTYWKRYAEDTSLYLRTDVQINFVSSDTGEVEQTYLSQAKEYLYTPSEE